MQFDQRGFLAHRYHQGVDDEKDNKSPGDNIVRDDQRTTRKQYSNEDKIRIVLDGLRGEDSIAELCRREGISQGLCYKWSKDFKEAGTKRLAGDLLALLYASAQGQNVEIKFTDDLHNLSVLGLDLVRPLSDKADIAVGTVLEVTGNGVGTTTTVVASPIFDLQKIETHA